MTEGEGITRFSEIRYMKRRLFAKITISADPLYKVTGKPYHDKSYKNSRN